MIANMGQAKGNTMAGFKKASWYMHRLVSMSPAELGHRMQQRLTIMQDQRQGLPGSELKLDNSRCWESFLQEELSTFFFRWEERPSLQQLFKAKFQQEYEATLKTAASLMDHTIQLFDKTIELGGEISWQADPLSQKSWPDEFYASIDTRSAGPAGGVKWVWELNRHHQFVTLGKAFYLSGDERFAQELFGQWQGWIEGNPPLRGINWTSSLELALRLINWSWALAFARRSPALTETLFTQIMQSVTEQTTYISRHLSAYSSANNHLIGEAAGLAVSGLCFPWLPGAAAWRDTGLKILERELEPQITADGVPAEQAISYLAFVLDFNLVVWRLAQLNGFDPPKIWHDRLGTACDFITHLMDEAGHLPAIGDSDDAWVVRLDDRCEVNNFRALVAAAAVILERPDLKACSQRWDEKSQWLLGESGRSAFAALPAIPCNLGSRLFEDGGYGVMRAAGRVIITDFGPLGYLSTAAHGHADALSLLISIADTPLLVDPGTYAYQEGGAWRDFFRSTAAHNTITVDGTDQSDMKGTFLWGQRAAPRLLNWQSAADEDLLIAEHDGYAKFGVTHRRVVIFHKPHWLIVGDELLGTGYHQISQFWHLHPEWQAAAKEDHISIYREGLTLGMKSMGIPSAITTIHQGESDPIQGWVSAQYGFKEPAAVIKIAANLTLPARFITIFALKEGLSMAGESETITQLVRTLDRAWG